MNPRQLKTLDRFAAHCWEAHRQPYEQQRAIIARRSAVKFMWVMSAMAVFSFFSLLAAIAK